MCLKASDHISYSWCICMYTWWQNKVRKRECVITAHSIVISHVLYSRTHSSWVSHREGLTCNFNDFAIKLLATNQYRERGRQSGVCCHFWEIVLETHCGKNQQGGGSPSSCPQACDEGMISPLTFCHADLAHCSHSLSMKTGQYSLFQNQS